MSTVFGSTQSHSSPTSHGALIPGSSDGVSSDGSELEFAGSNDNEDSSLVEDQQEQSGGVRGRGCMQPRRRGCGRRPGKGVAEMDLGLPVKQYVEWALGRGLGGLLVESHRISSL